MQVGAYFKCYSSVSFQMLIGQTDRQTAGKVTPVILLQGKIFIDMLLVSYIVN